MAKTMYSWSTFPRSDTHPRDQIRHGDEVTADDFDSQEDFDELVRIGAIREQPYPIPRNDDGSYAYDGSPREFALAQIEKMDKDQYDAVVVNTWATPALRDKAEEAMDEADWHPELPDEESVAAADKAEKGQETRKALEAQAGKGKGPQLSSKRTSE